MHIRGCAFSGDFAGLKSDLIMSDLIETTQTQATHSMSVDIKPQDKRCRYWAKIIRKGADIPMPWNVAGANDLPGRYINGGSEELLPGDFLIEGEANHHLHARGWSYWITYCADTPESSIETMRVSGDIKAALKSQGMPVEYLTGAGDVAAAVRALHGLRMGLQIK